MKCAPLESRHVKLTPTVHFLVKCTLWLCQAANYPAILIFLEANSMLTRKAVVDINRRQMYAVMLCNYVELPEMHDVERCRIYGRRPKPLCPPHLSTLQYYSLLRFFI